MDIKEQVKRSVSITEVVSSYVNLKPAGKYLKGLCPFHTEKTPSFFVMPDKDTFSCYGCNKFGDTIAFVQEIENLTFPEALDFLIETFNIPVQREKIQGGVKKDVYGKINEKARKYFQDNLLDSAEGKKALEYLSKREISRSTLESFSLGYAPNQWDGLYSFLRKQSADIEKAIELGLLVKSQNYRIYDRFRGRIIFPIFAESDPRTPIAFGGRTIFDDPAKYLNSPDTPLYKKSKHLYGFHLAKKSIRETKKAILVEGYFDMVSLFQNGVENVVASLGTALTEHQVNLLARFSDRDRIYIYYDSDKAGIEATLRGIEKMFEQNINPRIISPPLDQAKDPDDFIREKGLKAFNQLLENAVDGFKFFLGWVSQKYDVQVPEKKYEAIQAIINAVNKIGEPIIKDEYIRKAADFFHVEEHLLRSKVKDTLPGTAPVPAPKGLLITLAERIFLENVLAVPGFIGEVKELLNDELLSVLASQNIIRGILENFNPGEIMNFSDIQKKLSDAEKGELRNIFEHSGISPKDRAQREKEIESCIVEFHDILNKREDRRLNQEIKLAARANNLPMLEQLIQKKTNYKKSKYDIMKKNKNLIQGAPN